MIGIGDAILFFSGALALPGGGIAVHFFAHHFQHGGGVGRAFFLGRAQTRKDWTMPERYDTDLDDAPDIIRSVVELKPLPNYRLWLKFENGVEKIFDFAPYLGYPICAPLKDPRVFNAVELRDGTATWLDGELDMAEETLYNEGVTLKNASRQILLANLPNGV